MPRPDPLAHPLPSPAQVVRRGWPLRVLALALALVTAPAMAMADERWDGSVGVTSRYVFRGLQPRGDAPSVQVDLHRRFADDLFAGAWLSSGPDRRGAYGRHELNLYAGLGWRAREHWALSLRLVHYRYPDSRLGNLYDHDELAGMATYEDWLVLSLSVSPNLTLFSSQGLAEGRRSRAFEVSVRRGLWGPVSALAAAGYYDIEAHFGTAYRAWTLGLALRQGPAELTLSRYGTDGAARRLFGTAATDDNWVLSAAWSF